MSELFGLNMQTLDSTGLLRLNFMKCLIADTIADFFISKDLDTYGNCILYGRISKDSCPITIYSPKDKDIKNKVYVEQKDLAKELSKVLLSLNISEFLNHGHFDIICEKTSANVEFYNYYVDFVTNRLKFNMWKNSKHMQETKHKNHIAEFADLYAKFKKDDPNEIKEYASYKFPKKDQNYILFDENFKPAIACVTLEASGATSFTSPDNFKAKFVKILEAPDKYKPLPIIK